MEGIVKWFDAVKGFGFIRTSENTDFFVHRSGIADGIPELEPEQKVEFDIRENERGPVAVNVKVI